jgi:hypothetical protein
MGFNSLSDTCLSNPRRCTRPDSRGLEMILLEAAAAGRNSASRVNRRSRRALTLGGAWVYPRADVRRASIREHL